MQLIDNRGLDECGFGPYTMLVKEFFVTEAARDRVMSG